MLADVVVSSSQERHPIMLIQFNQIFRYDAWKSGINLRSLKRDQHADQFQTCIFIKRFQGSEEWEATIER